MANFAYLRKLAWSGFPLYVPPMRLSPSPILDVGRDVIYVTDRYAEYGEIKIGIPPDPSVRVTCIKLHYRTSKNTHIFSI